MMIIAGAGAVSMVQLRNTADDIRRFSFYWRCSSVVVPRNSLQIMEGGGGGVLSSFWPAQLLLLLPVSQQGFASGFLTVTEEGCTEGPSF